MRDRPDSHVPTMLDVLALPDAQRECVLWLVRQRTASLPDVASRLGVDQSAAESLLADLTNAGFVQRVDGAAGIAYRARVAVRPGRAPTRDLLDSLTSTGDVSPST